MAESLCVEALQFRSKDTAHAGSHAPSRGTSIVQRAGNARGNLTRG
eukprot:CAMPEP_0179321006 /NCGR_PEP_ID=MMETSP0797-20121207/58376_1 /TAXON_ID=47934 /ORGANISM="Dinophysis acuminata, Strain DAEP01" /LENGTH=45 /DNA_ID= /DNA_START= /DNA_END= /DNA_ORIENTATION=